MSVRPLAVAATLAVLAVAEGAEAAATRYHNPTLTVAGGKAAPELDPASIPDSEYVTATRDGRLRLRGRVARFWGVIGGIPNYAGGRREGGGEIPFTADEKRANAPRFHADNEAMITRFQDLGFNLCRLWRSTDDESYTPGDGSFADVLDHFVATAKRKDFRLWLAGMNPGVGVPTDEDVAVVDDAGTAEAWKQAVAETRGTDAQAAGKRRVLDRARFFDERLEALVIRNTARLLTHRNRYTGLRWCDDPIFAAFELSNEEWWIPAMLRGEWQQLPSFFRNQLFARWNGFLARKYPDAAALAKAWGALLPGEDPAKGSVAFAPMAGKVQVAIAINDSAAHAVAAATGTGDATLDSAQLGDARARDVLEFLTLLHVGHKQRVAAALKPLGRATRLAPLAFDTGIGYEIQSAWLHQNADATVHDAYVNGSYPQKPKPEGPFDDPLQEMQARMEWGRMRHNRGDWVSWLEKPPGIAQGVPWLEHNRAPDKPFFAYETQIQQPAKYRADFPLRLAALASIQDWSIACWHYWGAVDDISSAARPFDRPLDVTVGGHPQGYHYTFDEVQNAMMRAAAFAFRGMAYQPAPQPTTFIYGRRALTEPLSMRYAGSYGMTGMDMLPTTYQHGVRIVIDPSREDDEVIGPVVKAADYETHNPYTPTPEITFDWKQGFLRMDSPASMVWTGFLAHVGGTVAFANGATLSDVSIANPAGIYEPIGPDEQYLAFALCSEDGAPLDRTKRAMCSLVSTSFNTGFSLSLGWNDGKTRQGGLPVLVARVAGTVTCPAIDGMSYVLRDWHMQPIGEGRVVGGRLVIPNDRPVFVIELNR